MKVEDLIIFGKKHISSTHSKMLLANLLDKNPLELLNCLDQVVEEELIQQYKTQIEALSKNQPIQYVIGNVNFYGNIFKVTQSTLIPRFETEELVDYTLKLAKKIFDHSNLDIIDLGTGTGCIGITIKKHLPNSKVTLLDISRKALEVAAINAKDLNVDVTLIQNDMLDNIENKYDIIISNPPYIKTTEEIEDIVFKNEPHLALYAGVDGLDCYRKILENCSKNLKEHYLIAFEIGESQKEDVINLVNDYLKDGKIETKKDLQGRDRMIFIYKQKEDK